MSANSYWKTTELPQFPALSANLNADVVIVGGGITGVSSACLLKRAGRRVVLLERHRCGQLDTGNTTAHLTCVTDRPLRKLADTLGRDHAQAVWDAGLSAIDQIHDLVGEAGIECDLARVPGYYHAAISGQTDERADLQRQAEIANELGFPAEYQESVPLFGRPGVRFPNQAVFHPLKYLAGLLQSIPGDDSHVFERTEADHFESDGDRVRVHAGRFSVACERVVIATHAPISGLKGMLGATLLQSKIAPHTTYAIAARVPARSVPRACYWDTSDPYYFLRLAPAGPGSDLAIFGGLDHKTGQAADSVERFARLENTLREYVPAATVEFRWSGQVMESHDGLPLIGWAAEQQFVATGYAGNGMTFGTLAAMMTRDAICGRKNPWSELFDPKRTTLKGGTWNYLRENADYPYYMIKDRLTRSESISPEALPRGTGRILVLDRRRVAVYRDAEGRLTLRSPVCTHMGCIVHWNEAESTWDCPCHGSRFRPSGEVLAGPAETPLDPI